MIALRDRVVEVEDAVVVDAVIGDAAGVAVAIGA